MTTTVVNIKRLGGVSLPFDVYIGRPMFRGGWRLQGSKWANPYKIDLPGKPRDGSREEVIAKYRQYVLERPDLMAALPELRGKVLGCWCLPLPCHGTVLAELADAGPARPGKQLIVASVAKAVPERISRWDGERSRHHTK
jgi:hypothetical protein